MLLVAFTYVVLGAAASLRPLFTAADLAGINECLTCRYILVTNISVTDPWTPLGSTANPFRGSLDGNGNTITLAVITPTDEGSVGLFGVIGNATVMRLGLLSNGSFKAIDPKRGCFVGLLSGAASNATVFACSLFLNETVPLSTDSLVIGGLCGTLRDSLVTQSYINMNLTVSNVREAYIGGVVGNCSATKIGECDVSVNITSETMNYGYIGGIVSLSMDTVITKTVASATILSQQTALREIVGGIICLTKGDAENNSIADCIVDMAMVSLGTDSPTIGGAVGLCEQSIVISTCEIRMQVLSIGSGALVGGAIGAAAVARIAIDEVVVNATVNVSAEASSQRTVLAGGLVGSLTAQMSTIRQCVAVVNITLATKGFSVGGLVGSGTGSVATLTRNGVLGIINVTASGEESSKVGGILGLFHNAHVWQNYFIGEILCAGNSNFAVGALVGESLTFQVKSSYALANISIRSLTARAGGIAVANFTTIKGCYVAVNISAVAPQLLFIGSMIGSLNTGSSVRDSFAFANLSVLGTTGPLSLGGFVGYVAGKSGCEFIERCYVWGVVAAKSSVETGSVLSGFVGSIPNSLDLTYSLAYVNVTVTNVLLGLFVGNVRQVEGLTEEDAGKIRYSVAYVSPGGNVTDIEFVWRNEGIQIADSYCAGYANTKGCTLVETLNTQTFLKAFDFSVMFQLNNSLANGSLTLQVVPAPASVSDINAPLLAMPTASRSFYWIARDWITQEMILHGFPYLRSLDYKHHCGPSTDCHGTGISPLDAICDLGWSSPQSSPTSFLSSFHRCNKFECSDRLHCNFRGNCVHGKCVCDNGYSGVDCMNPLCPEIDGLTCSFGMCIPLASASSVGVCQCQRTEFLSLEGSCSLGCHPIGLGMCVGNHMFECFKDYTTESRCFEYNCFAASTNVCNGQGVCVDGKCNCREGSIIIGGNCYTDCAAGRTKDCIDVTCGPDYSCASRGLCTINALGTAATCVCNVNMTGQPTETHFGGMDCNDCEFGYLNYQGNCVLDKCPKCIGGTCVLSESNQVIICICLSGHTLVNGECIPDSCVECVLGSCVTIPGGEDLLAFFCICSPGVKDESCFFFDCLTCGGGLCTPNTKSMAVECVCPNGYMLNVQTRICESMALSHITIAIIVSSIVFGCVMISIAALVGIYVRSKRIRIERAIAEISDTYFV